MDSGILPKYEYRPSDIITTTPFMRTHSGRRARFTGDTYFRSKEVGMQSNNISLEIVQPSPLTGILYITNHNTLPSENVVASLGVVYDTLDAQALTHDVVYRFECMSPNQINVFRNGIRIDQIASGELFVGEEGVTIRITEMRSGGFLEVKPRVHQYGLKWITVSDPTGAAGPWSGFDIEDLRLKMKNDTWVEMIERSFKDGAPVVSPPNDVQDEGEDEKVLMPFSQTFLAGGDGLPDVPDGQKTGPSRSLVHLNYSEMPNGEMGVVNVVYEWSGTSNTIGEWVNLF